MTNIFNIVVQLILNACNSCFIAKRKYILKIHVNPKLQTLQCPQKKGKKKKPCSIARLNYNITNEMQY